MIDFSDLESALRLTQELQADLAASGLEDTVQLTRPAYVPVEDTAPAPVKQAAQFATQFKLKQSRRNQQLHDCYISANQKHKLELFTLFTLGSSPVGDYDTTVATFRSCLDRERALLQREIAEADGGRKLRPHRAADIGVALRSARDRKGQTQETAAEQIGCSASTISRIELGVQTPRKHLDAIRRYIESAE
jgi:DNA-binding XRE family transcriptional regulator